MQHYSPPPSEIVQRFKFHSRFRRPGETVTTFCANYTIHSRLKLCCQVQFIKLDPHNSSHQRVICHATGVGKMDTLLPSASLRIRSVTFVGRWGIWKPLAGVGREVPQQAAAAKSATLSLAGSARSRKRHTHCSPCRVPVYNCGWSQWTSVDNH